MKHGNQGAFSGLVHILLSSPWTLEDLALKDLAVLYGLSRVHPENDTMCVPDEGGPPGS